MFAKYFGILSTVYLLIDANVQIKEFYNINDSPDLFMKFMRDYTRYYINAHDFLVHYDAFRKALIDINYWNNLTPPDSVKVFGINKYADYTVDEWQARKRTALYGIINRH